MGAKTVLVVDDDDDTVAFVRASLAPIGVSVISAEDAEKGLALARSEAPDLVILDVFLPRKLGLLSLNDLKSAPETGDIPVVILTSIRSRLGVPCSVEEVKARFGARPDAFLDKPVAPGRLQRVVQSLLSRGAATKPTDS